MRSDAIAVGLVSTQLYVLAFDLHLGTDSVLIEGFAISKKYVHVCSSGPLLSYLHI